MASKPKASVDPLNSESALAWRMTVLWKHANLQPILESAFNLPLTYQKLRRQT